MSGFRILVDADACPVKGIIVKIAKSLKIEVFMFIDTSHQIDDGYSSVVTLDQSRDAVDIALVNYLKKGDIVVTQDYGVATMALAKGGRVLNQDGLCYTFDNIDRLLFERHLSAKVRRSGGRTRGHSKRTQEDDLRFERAFRSLCSGGMG